MSQTSRNISGNGRQSPPSDLVEACAGAFKDSQ
jgi:hypothetical protein